MWVNRLVYCSMALFFGSFGFHKFYVKKYKTGLLYLIFCWTFIPLVISIVEALWAFLIPALSNESGEIFIP